MLRTIALDSAQKVAESFGSLVPLFASVSDVIHVKADRGVTKHVFFRRGLHLFHFRERVSRFCVDGLRHVLYIWVLEMGLELCNEG